MCKNVRDQGDTDAWSVEFPPYRYDAQRERRPLTDSPEGWRALETFAPRPLLPDSWRRNGVYLFAMDLFNRGSYWEAHEEWESLWVLAGRRGTTADFLKGLIKLAAAGVKCREERIRGVARHAARAVQLFQGVRDTTGEARFAGLSLTVLADEGNQVRAAAEAGVFPGKCDAEVIFSFRLQPE